MAEKLISETVSAITLNSAPSMNAFGACSRASSPAPAVAMANNAASRDAERVLCCCERDCRDLRAVAPFGNKRQRECLEKNRARAERRDVASSGLGVSFLWA